MKKFLAKVWHIISFPFVILGKAIASVFYAIVLFIVKIILKIFIKSKTLGRENVGKNKRSVVFVCNHLEIYGPVCMVLRFPYSFRPWVIDKMFDVDDAKLQLFVGAEKNFKIFPPAIRRWGTGVVARLMHFALKKYKGIPVHRDITHVMETFDKSVALLKKKKNVTIFPEDPTVTGGYPLKGVGVFQKGFAQLGTEYYKATGKALTFYPVYISKENKTINICAPTTYDISKPAGVERKRLVAYLHDTMQAKALEVETHEDMVTYDSNGAVIVPENAVVSLDEEVATK